MNESPEHDAHVLDGLIDRVEAGIRALADAPAALSSLTGERQAAVAELRAARIERSRGEPDGGGLLGAAERVIGRFLGDTSDPTPERTGAGLDGLEREEDALQARFEAALADDRLSGPVRDAVLRAYDRVKPGHDAVRQAALAARGEV